jgi:hypothetical protein
VQAMDRFRVDKVAVRIHDELKPE